MRGPELPGHPVVVVQRLPADRRARRLNHRVDAAGGLLGLGQRRLADVVQVADDPARALVAQPDQAADVANAGHLADPSGLLGSGRGQAGGEGGRGGSHPVRSVVMGRTVVVRRVTGGESRRGYGEHRRREQQHPENPAGEVTPGSG